MRWDGYNPATRIANGDTLLLRKLQPQSSAQEDSLNQIPFATLVDQLPIGRVITQAIPSTGSTPDHTDTIQGELDVIDAASPAFYQGGRRALALNALAASGEYRIRQPLVIRQDGMTLLGAENFGTVLNPLASFVSGPMIVPRGSTTAPCLTLGTALLTGSGGSYHATGFGGTVLDLTYIAALGQLSSLTDFTIDMTLNPDAGMTGQNHVVLSSSTNAAGGGGDGAFDITYRSDFNRLDFIWGDALQTIHSTATNSVMPGTSYALRVVQSASNVSVYLGTPGGSCARVLHWGTTATVPQSSRRNEYIIVGRNDAVDGFHGRIDAMRFSNSARTADGQTAATLPAAKYTSDANTLHLDNFDTITRDWSRGYAGVSGYNFTIPDTCTNEVPLVGVKVQGIFFGGSGTQTGLYVYNATRSTFRDNYYSGLWKAIRFFGNCFCTHLHEPNVSSVGTAIELNNGALGYGSMEAWDTAGTNVDSANGWCLDTYGNTGGAFTGMRLTPSGHSFGLVHIVGSSEVAFLGGLQDDENQASDMPQCVLVEGIYASVKFIGTTVVRKSPAGLPLCICKSGATAEFIGSSIDLTYGGYLIEFLARPTSKAIVRSTQTYGRHLDISNHLEWVDYDGPRRAATTSGTRRLYPIGEPTANKDVDSGGTFPGGASAATLLLPTAEAGDHLEYEFEADGTAGLTVTTDGTDTLTIGGVSLTTITLHNIGDRLHVRSKAAGVWDAVLTLAPGYRVLTGTVALAAGDCLGHRYRVGAANSTPILPSTQVGLSAEFESVAAAGSLLTCAAMNVIQAGLTVNPTLSLSAGSQIAKLTCATPGKWYAQLFNGAAIVDDTGPIVVNIDSTNDAGVYLPGAVLTITIQFGEIAVVSLGGGSLELTLAGLADPAVYASGSGTDTLTFTVTVQSGDAADPLDVTSIDLAGGATLKDGAGNDASTAVPDPGDPGSLSANKAITVATWAPDDETSLALHESPALGSWEDSGETTPNSGATQPIGSVVESVVGNWRQASDPNRPTSALWAGGTGGYAILFAAGDASTLAPAAAVDLGTGAWTVYLSVGPIGEFDGLYPLAQTGGLPAYSVIGIISGGFIYVATSTGASVQTAYTGGAAPALLRIERKTDGHVYFTGTGQAEVDMGALAVGAGELVFNTQGQSAFSQYSTGPLRRMQVFQGVAATEAGFAPLAEAWIGQEDGVNL